MFVYQTSSTVKSFLFFFKCCWKSDKAARKLMNSIACIVRKKVDNKLTNSYVSLLCDVTTDISVAKKLGV